VNADELQQFVKDVNETGVKGTYGQPFNRLAVIVPNDWDETRAEAIGKILELPVVRANVEKPGVMT
jgi:hypothetical protein